MQLVMILNGLFHFVFISSILGGACGNITPDSSCSIEVVMTLLLGAGMLNTGGESSKYIGGFPQNTYNTRILG